jgi:N-acetylmuramoyl-L-alanine amidase
MLVAMVALAGCGTAADATPNSAPSLEVVPSAHASASAPTAAIVPAPGSDSDVYPPNPAAIVVAVDAGHGGCLDWGVPDPSLRGEKYAEKTMTLGIARALRDRLEGEGVTVLMLRDGDLALAGDDYPAQGCTGPGWRDANGDGESGFDPEGAVRTRDELQARLDVANLAGADVLVSIHINSPFDGGQTIEIAFTESFYTDETPWGPTATARLAGLIQGGVVQEVGAVAGYERGDRGITAHNFYMVAPPLLDPTAERPDPRKQPTRGAFMPAVLSEVGSITLREEQDLLVTDAGQTAVADGIFSGLREYFSDRPLAARIELADAERGSAPIAIPGSGPPFWARVAGDDVSLRLTNTGTDGWPEGIELVLGWEATDDPYLPAAPASLDPVAVAVPNLAPGEALELTAPLDPPGSGRHVAWLTLRAGSVTLAEVGSPALQLASE